MHKSAILQIYLFFISHGFCSHVLFEKSQRRSSAGKISQLESLALLLLARRSDSAFTPCSLGACLPSVGLSRLARTKTMKMLPLTLGDLEEIASLKDEGEVQEDLSNLKVPELREKLKAAGLKVSGSKAELISRLEDHAATRQTSPDDTEEPMEKEEAPAAPQDAGQVPRVNPEDLTDEELEVHARNMLHHHRQYLRDASSRIYLEDIDYAVMHKVLSRHPAGSAKLGDGIAKIFVAPHSVHGNHCYHIERVDGTEDDISYRKCLGVDRDSRQTF